MKSLITAAVIIFLGVLLAYNCSEVGYLNQNETGFRYDANGGATNRTSAPAMDFGWNFAIGYNARFFSINSEINTYSFTHDITKESPYREAMTWDSREGMTMQSNFTISAQVDDPWAFFQHYGEPQRGEVVDGVKDMKIYQAIRDAAMFSRAYMCQLAGSASGDELRTNPNAFALKITKATHDYMKNYGISIREVFFSSRITVPTGESVTNARSEYQKNISKLEELKKQVVNARENKDIDVENARIQATKIAAEGTQIANARLEEARAIASKLENLIQIAGTDGAVSLLSTEVQATLMQSGNVEVAYLTPDSIIVRGLYDKTEKTSK